MSTAAATSIACIHASTIMRFEFYAFDCLVCDSEDLRKLPLTMRKTNLSRLLAQRGRRHFRRSPRWIKVKNRQHPAFSRVMEQF